MIEPLNNQSDAPWLSFVPRHVALDLAAHPAESPVGRVQRFDAVALFADVSGFTPISEALARTGRVGAEELTAILNSYFAPMIALVQSYGGSVGKFGGDAMTVLFPMVDAQPQQVAHRAVACALAMQAAMPRYAAIPTSAGRFSLQMKAGLAVGAVFCTSVGNPAHQLEYVIAGSAIDRCAEAEHYATKGEVVVHRALLDLAGTLRPVEQRGDFAVIAGIDQQPARTPQPEPVALPAPARELLARYVHPAIAHRLASGQTDFVNEHRKVTVLFVRFAGFDYDGDPQVATRLQSYLVQALATIARYDGFLSRVDMGDKGSKYIVLFGAPVIHEDDEERALRCALELVALPGATAQVGVNTGFVFCGGVGSEVRQEYTVMGDSVNLAARLMQAAAPDQVLVGPTTRAAVGAGFGWDEPQALLVKGKSQPVSVASLRGLAQPTGDGLLEPGYLLPLIGREVEQERARQVLVQARIGHGQVLGITGEAGMGKSRLAAVVVEQARSQGFAVFGGACQSYGGSSSYLCWRALWRGFFGLDPRLSAASQIAQLQATLSESDPQLAARMPLLGPLLNLAIPDTALTASLDAQLRAELLRNLLLECLRRRATSTPLLLLLEDCHWIDPLSLELLEYLGRNLHDLPLLLLVLYRPPHGVDDPAAWARRLPNFGELALVELEVAEAQRLAALKLGQLFEGLNETPAALVARVVARAGGNPFYLEELLNYLRDRGLDPQNQAALTTLDLPASLHSLILSRIDQLDEAAKTTLKVASVIGRVFKASWLWGSYAGVGTPEAVSGQLQLLSRLDLTPLDRAEPEPEYLFKHITTQEVAYESLAFATRATLHEAVAGYIEAAFADAEVQYLDVLAYHYGRSQNSAKQRIYFRKAGAAAKAAYANAAAVDYYTRLLPLLHGDEQSTTLCDLAEIWQLTGKWPEAEQAFKEALALAEAAQSLGVVARCRSGLGQLYGNTQSYAEALPWLEQARSEFAAVEDYQGLAQALQGLSFAYIQQGEHEQALAASRQQLEIATRSGDQVGISAALGNIGLVYSDWGDNEQALNYLQQAHAVATSAGYRRGVVLTGTDIAGVYWQKGEYSAALTSLQQALSVASEIGYLQAIGFMLGNAAILYEQLGALENALACYTRGLGIAAELGDWPNIVPIVGNLATALAAQNRIAEAEQLLERSIALGRELNLPYLLCDYLYHEAELYALARRYLEAVSLNREARTVADEIQNREIQFKSLLLDIRLRVALDELEAGAAVAALLELRDEWAEDEEQAAIYYTIWQIDSGREDARRAAAECYRALYEHSPNVEYRQRYAELTGEELPPPPPLPPLPEALLGPPLDLDALLERVLSAAPGIEAASTGRK